MSLTVSASGITFNDLTTLSTSVLSTANIANNSITTAKIVPGAVITEDLANGAVTAAKLAPGILSAQAALKTDTQVGSTVAGTETDITGLSLSVVVPSATAKVLLLGYITAAGTYAGFRIKRNGTDIALGDAAGTRTRVLVTAYDQVGTNFASSIPINFLDSPNAAGTYTYKATMVCSFGPYAPNINRTVTDTNDTYSIRGTSQLIALVIP